MRPIGEKVEDQIGASVAPGGMTMQERCTVCGMRIDSKDNADRTQYEGKTYFFCGEACKEEFDLYPERYVETEAKKR
jgi:Cu+-exporting ATPase